MFPIQQDSEQHSLHSSQLWRLRNLQRSVVHLPVSDRQTGFPSPMGTTEINTSEATITSDPCVRADPTTWRPKLHKKTNLRVALLRPYTPHTKLTQLLDVSTRFLVWKTISSTQMLLNYRVHQPPKYIPGRLKKKLKKKTHNNKRKKKQTEAFTQARLQAAPRSGGPVSQPPSAAAAAGATAAPRQKASPDQALASSL